MAIKRKIKYKTNDMLNSTNTENFKQNDRDRGTSPAELRSSGPKQRPERVATKLGGEEVSSGRGDLPTDRVRFEEHDEKEYKKHLKKFFKGEDEDNS